MERKFRNNERVFFRDFGGGWQIGDVTGEAPDGVYIGIVGKVLTRDVVGVVPPGLDEAAFVANFRALKAAAERKIADIREDARVPVETHMRDRSETIPTRPVIHDERIANVRKSLWDAYWALLESEGIMRTPGILPGF